MEAKGHPHPGPRAVSALDQSLATCAMPVKAAA